MRSIAFWKIFLRVLFKSGRHIMNGRGHWWLLAKFSWYSSSVGLFKSSRFWWEGLLLFQDQMFPATTFPYSFESILIDICQRRCIFQPYMWRTSFCFKHNVSYYFHPYQTTLLFIIFKSESLLSGANTDDVLVTRHLSAQFSICDISLILFGNVFLCQACLQCLATES